MFIKQKLTKTALVTIASVDFFGLSEEDGGKWVLMCEKHKEFIQDTNKKRLWEHNDQSWAWCMSCQEEHIDAIVAEKLGA